MSIQEERRVYLIKALRREMPRYQNVSIPDDEEEQKKLLRSLFNLRPPMPASMDFLDIQDAYLSEEVRRRGIVDGSLLAPVKNGGRIALWQGDITRLKTDAIVNAANRALLGCFQPCHSCIDNIIHTLSGVQLRLKCSEIMEAQGHEEPVGTAKITPAYNLPCKYILHTVGPAVSGPLKRQDCGQLEACYESCLELAVEHGVKSIAFCCISTGVFQFPQDRAAEIAVETVSRFLNGSQSLRQVVFNVYTDSDRMIYQRLLEHGPL